jgi:hypothetical protein
MTHNEITKLERGVVVCFDHRCRWPAGVAVPFAVVFWRGKRQTHADAPNVAGH